MKLRSHLLSTSVARGIAVLCAAIFATTTHSAHAGINVWTSHGPSSGYITALVIDPSTPTTLYAATSNDVFKSTDGGATWSVASAGLIDMESVFALAIDPITPSTLYASISIGCGEIDCTYLYKSTDAGATWSDTGLSGGGYSLAVDPITPSTLYAGAGGGVSKSTDAGATWSDTGLSGGGYPLAVDPIAPNTLYAGTGGGVSKSTDAGTTWTALDAGLTNTFVLALTTDPVTPSRLYAGTNGGGVYSIQQIAPCIGDCDARGSVTVDELITLVNVALGNAQPSACPRGVPSGAAVDVTLLIQAVNSGLNGCPSSDLYVATSGALTGDGSVANPYRRITDAVARARAQRASGVIAPEEQIRIHVMPGTYVGSFNPTQLQNHPEYEVLPIILNVPRLAVLGGTVLVRDDRGLPTATEPESETILEPDPPLVPDQSLFLVTRTADGAVGNRVTVKGFVLDAGEGCGERYTHSVVVDRVSGFRISDNLTRRASFGITTRLASGTIEGNLLIDHFRAGTNVSGGSLAQPATVVINANRATGNGEHGLMNLAGAVFLPINTGRNTLVLVPLRTTFDRNDPEDLREIPDTLNVTLSDNDSSDNYSFGIRLYACILPGFGYQTQDATQPLTFGLTANVGGNTCAGNGEYGVAMEAGFPNRNDPRRRVVTFAGRFDGNSFGGNERAAALFDFTRWNVSLGMESPFVYKFVEGSTYQVTDVDGELAGFDYDHPVMDPISGSVLNNTFTVNGVEVPHGTSITP